MLDLAAGSSASSKPTATRQQLDQLFDTLAAEGGITAKQLFMQDDIEAHAKVKDIGYCYFGVSAPTLSSSSTPDSVNDQYCCNVTLWYVPTRYS